VHTKAASQFLQFFAAEIHRIGALPFMGEGGRIGSIAADAVGKGAPREGLGQLLRPPNHGSTHQGRAEQQSDQGCQGQWLKVSGCREQGPEQHRCLQQNLAQS
jgi:hypothetical protein